MRQIVIDPGLEGVTYRTPSVVEPLPADPVLRALRLAGARPFVSFASDQHPACPFCRAKRGFSDSVPGPGPRLEDEGRLCLGPRRWWRPWGCALYVPHFHVRCVTCRARWIMASADAPSLEE